MQVKNDDIEEQLAAEKEKKDFLVSYVPLKKRCDDAGIPIELLDDNTDGSKYVKVHFPQGREKRHFFFYYSDSINKLLECDFEKIVFLSGYEAIANYSEDYIEAVVQPVQQNSFPVNPALYRNLFQPMDDSKEKMDEKGFKPIIIKSSEADKGIEVEISFRQPLHPAFAAGFYPRNLIKLRITGAKIKTHDHATSVLEKISDSVFFQIDALANIPVTLAKPRKFSRRKKQGKLLNDSLMFPKMEYDRAPLSLYWYARSADSMPLLQFLAYYQAIEFYYPTFAQTEAKKRLKNLLKDPSFRPDRDTDLGKIISSIWPISSSGHMDERSQLIATVTECVNETELRNFLVGDADRFDFFSQKKSNLSFHKINVKTDDPTILHDVALRIYEIRCRIVHTKAGGKEKEFELLLPNSRESELLSHDIELIQFVAKQVIVAASTPIVLE